MNKQKLLNNKFKHIFVIKYLGEYEFVRFCMTPPSTLAAYALKG